MRALIIGGSCLLGKYLLATCPPGSTAVATWYSLLSPGCTYRLDITDQLQIAMIMGRVKPDVVLLLSSIGDVDWCERNYAMARELNIGGAVAVRDECDHLGVPLVYFSSNAVFAGDSPPYGEDAERHPVNRYGQTRVDAENAVMKGDNWLILRLFLLYGWPPPGARSNWAAQLVGLYERNQRVKLVGDTWWQPSYAMDVARVVWRILHRHLNADLEPARLHNTILHLAPAEKLTLFEFGHAVAKAFNVQAYIEPADTSALKIAPRPVDSTYDVSKAAGLGLKLIPPSAGLAYMRREQQGEPLERIAAELTFGHP